MSQHTHDGADALELRGAFSRARAIAIECGLAFSDVDAILDVAPGTFRSICMTAPASHPAEARVRMLADGLDYAVRLLGGSARATIWLRTPHPAMEDMSPLLYLTEHPESLRSIRDALRREWETVQGPRELPGYDPRNGIQR